MSKTLFDLYLKRIYETECKFDIKQDEVDFIRIGVESIVGNIVEKILQRYERDVEEKHFRWLKERCIDYKKSSRDDIIRVGSFYEGTRNKFPDEFDIMFPLLIIDPKGIFSPDTAKYISFNFTAISYAIVGRCVTDLLKDNDMEPLLWYPEKTGGGRAIMLYKLQGPVGPAMTLILKYINAWGIEKDISVDLVSAIVLKGDFSNWCNIEPFSSLIRDTGRVFIVGQALTFTETEVRFMREVLSHGHRKVYRLLKILICGVDDTIFNLNTNKKCEYSSYIIKTMIINHHFKCKRFACLSKCLLDVLDDMCTYGTLLELPLLVKCGAYKQKLKPRELFLVSQLENLTRQLKRLQNQEIPRFDL